MSIETVETLVVGGGQAGLAMSEHLSACGVPHLVLEQQHTAERWRSERWDSSVANGPAWHDRSRHGPDHRRRSVGPAPPMNRAAPSAPYNGPLKAFVIG